MISAGESQPDMARKVNVTSEAVRLCINRTGQHDLWRERRSSYEQRLTSLRQTLADALLARLYSMAEQEGWEYTKALEHDRHRNNDKRNIPIEKLVKFFRECRIAKESENPVTMEELARKSEIGTYGSAVQGLMEKARLDPFFERGPKFPKSRIETIKKVFDSELSTADISYFSGISFPAVGYHLHRMGRARKPRLKQIGRNSEDILTYRRASEIYKAQDLDFTNDETSYLLDLNPRLVSYAIENRREIGGEITKVLDILYPEQRHEKPYLEK